MGSLSVVLAGEEAVELRRVAKRYAGIVAVDYIGLDVKYGEIFGLLGRARVNSLR